MKQYYSNGSRRFLPRGWTFTEIRLFVVLPVAGVFCGIMALIEALS